MESASLAPPGAASPVPLPLVNRASSSFLHSDSASSVVAAGRCPRAPGRVPVSVGFEPTTPPQRVIRVWTASQ